MGDASAGAEGWDTLCFALSLCIGFVVCVLVASVAPRLLAARGLGRFLPWVVLGSLLVVTAASEVILSRHVPSRVMYVHADNLGSWR